MSEIQIEGMVFFALTRCSTNEQAAESIPQQKAAINKYAEDNGLTIFDFKALAGFSASTGSQVASIQEIIKKKLDGDKFDGIIVDSYSRLTRSESDAARLYADCIDAELIVVTVKEGLMMGGGTWAKRGAAIDQSEGYARDFGRNSNRGVAKRIKAGTFPPTMRMPYGCDRIYFDEMNKPMFRVSMLPDGRRAIHDPESPYAVRSYIPANERRLGLHRGNQRFEHAPSIQESGEIVKWIYEQFYEKGMKRHQMCSILNGRQVSSRLRKGWTSYSIDCVLENPIYIGYSVGCRTTSGVHSVRDTDAPKMHAMPRRPGRKKNMKEMRKRIQPIHRPVAQWKIVEQPLMKDLLTGLSKEKAIEEWERKKREGWLKIVPKRELRAGPPTSTFFLSKLLKTTDNVPMVGNGHQWNKHTYRYYITSRSTHQPNEKRPNERVRADLIENEVKAGLASILNDTRSLDSEIKAHIHQYQRDLLVRGKDTIRLREEKTTLESWYRFTFSVAGDRGRQLLQGEARRVEQRLDEIDSLLAAASSGSAIIEDEIPAIVASIKSQFSSLTFQLGAGSSESLRALASIFVSKATFDAHQRAVDIEFALPAAMMAKKDAIVEHFGMQKSSAYPTFLQHKSQDGLPLLSIHCTESIVKRAPCFTCSRVQRLAA